jgi:putative exporter of polyketide antibiotics
MKAYLNSEDSYYRYNEESIKEELIKSKPKKDYVGIGAVIFTLTVLSIVIGLTVYTALTISEVIK